MTMCSGVEAGKGEEVCGEPGNYLGSSLERASSLTVKRGLRQSWDWHCKNEKIEWLPPQRTFKIISGNKSKDVL